MDFYFFYTVSPRHISSFGAPPIPGLILSYLILYMSGLEEDLLTDIVETRYPLILPNNYRIIYYKSGIREFSPQIIPDSEIDQRFSAVLLLLVTMWKYLKKSQ